MFHTLKEMEYVHDLWYSGEYHYMLEVYVKDISNLNNLATDLYSRIGRTQTVLVMNINHHNHNMSRKILEENRASFKVNYM